MNFCPAVDCRTRVHSLSAFLIDAHPARSRSRENNRWQETGGREGTGHGIGFLRPQDSYRCFSCHLPFFPLLSWGGEESAVDGRRIRSLPLEQDYSNAFRTFPPFVGSRFEKRSFFQRIIAVPSLSSYFAGEICEKLDSNIFDRGETVRKGRRFVIWGMW